MQLARLTNKGGRSDTLQRPTAAKDGWVIKLGLWSYVMMIRLKSQLSKAWWKLTTRLATNQGKSPQSPSINQYKAKRTGNQK